MLEVNTSYANGTHLIEVPTHLNCGGYMGFGNEKSLNPDEPDTFGSPPPKTKELMTTKPDLNAENPPMTSAIKDFFVTNKKYFYVGVPIAAAFAAYLYIKKGKK